MAARREIHNLHCIFNLSICKALHLDQPIYNRVLLMYDKNENKKEIRIWHKELTEEMRNRQASWREKNVEGDDIRRNIRSEEIDIDELKKASNY